MGSAQQFSLRWNNYSHHITNALDDLRAEDELTDVTLCAEGDKIRAHKLLLSACSTFFRETFRENPCPHPVIILKGVSFIDLQAVVTFMYNGQVNVTQERLPCFLQTAEMLQIKGLTDMKDNKHVVADLGGGGGGGEESTTFPRHNHANSAAKKRVIAAGANAYPNPDHVHQPQPSSKRRKFIPSGGVGGHPDGGNSNSAGNAYNSPGPSSTNSGGGQGQGHGQLNNNHHHHHSNHNSDSNSNSNNAGGGGEDDLYPATTLLEGGGMLKYDPDEEADDLLQGDEDGGLGGLEDGLMMGDEDEEYPGNDCEEDGDNSMQDYSGGMEQGAIDCGLALGPTRPGGDCAGGNEGAEEDETEVMVLDGGGGYSIIAYSDSDDPPPPPPPPPHPKISFTPHPPISAPCSPPKTVSELLRVVNSTPSYFRSILPAAPNPSSVNKLFPFNNSTPSVPTPASSHINILRKKPRGQEPEELLELVNPLDLGSPSSSRLSSVPSKPFSPFVGEPLMDPDTGETMFPCLKCDKRYRLKSSLESHVKIHEGSENTCSICGQTMSRQRDLKRHVATVHRGLLMGDGSITYPLDIDDIVPARIRKPRSRAGGGGGSDLDQGSSSNDFFLLPG